ncbi:LuxR C-terminal-related transcriptional regulator [Actinophytocola sp.]|uniref:LuxR C-terminal-related transcriptional regulator n=1 Tax=Actinophytocola sp. TaxID=1872138 RepID=UPI002D65DFFD|nr:LuxR C-terminal-related transcriptional regulator [Actinophytocola sp.]HYQ68697.1 LuxR C-terminal-related transcriptional regulator [Actinophytocola sp.]
MGVVILHAQTPGVFARESSAQTPPGPSGRRQAPDDARAPLTRAYQALAARERAVFRALAVLPADFDAEAAAVVTGAGVAPEIVFEVLMRLESSSLVQRADSDSEQHRFRLRTAASRYAMALLTDAGEVRACYDRLVDWLWQRVRVLTQMYMLSHAESQWLHERVSYLAVAVDRTWSAGDDDRHDLLAVLLAYFYLHNGEPEKGQALIRRALDRDPASAYRSDLLTWTVWLSELDFAPEQAIRLLGEAVASARAGGNQWALTRALNTLATACSLVGDAEAANRHYEEAISTTSRLDDEFGLALCLHIYAWFLMGQGRGDEAAAAVAATPVTFPEQANPHQLGSYLFVRSLAELNAGQVAAAEQGLRDAVAVFRENDPSLPYVVEALALVALHTDQARRCLALLTAAALMRATAPASARTPGWWHGRLVGAERAAAQLLPDGEAKRVRRTAESLTRPQLLSYLLGESDMLAEPGSSELTRREFEIARLVAAGMANREVAEHLRIAGSTVSSHIKHIYTKLMIRSRTQLAAWVAATEHQDDRTSDPPQTDLVTTSRPH